MKNEFLYFIDYDEDQVLPRSGNVSLVNQYIQKMEEIGTPCIGVYTSKKEMMRDVLEYAHQARDGVTDYRQLTDEEMIDKINGNI